MAGSSLLFKVTFESETKWIKYNPEVITYQEVMIAAKAKFPAISKLEEYDLCDSDGAIIEEDLFQDYCISFKDLGPFIVKKKKVAADVLNDVIVIEVPNAQRINVGELHDVDQRVQRIATQEMPEIVEEYELKKTLSDSSVKLLNVKMVQHMVTYAREKGIALPTIEIKKSWARALVKMFPNLGDPTTEEGYETFFDPVAKRGKFETRIKNYYRKKQVASNSNATSSDVVAHAGPINRKTHVPMNKKNSKEKIIPSTSEDRTESEVADELELLKENPDIVLLANSHPVRHYVRIKEKMLNTYDMRRKIVTDKQLSPYVFEIFPRFLDTEGLITDDFEKLHPDTDLKREFLAIEDKILSNYETRGNAWKDIVLVDEEAISYNKSTRAFIGLLGLLEKRVAGKNKTDTLECFLVFSQTGSPLPVKNSPIPFIIAEGENISQISCYFLCLDGKAIPIEYENDIIAAVDVYFKSFFVFDVHYPTYLTNFLTFLQTTLYKISDVRNSATTSSNVPTVPVKVRDVRALLYPRVTS